MSPAEIDVLIVAGSHTRAVKAFAAAAGVARVADDLSTTVGNSGTAHPGLLLGNALEQAEPGQTIALVVLADGATAIVLRTTAAIASWRTAVSVAEQVDSGDDTLRYADFITWRGFLAKEPPRRPDPVGPAAPPTYRSSRYKYGFVAHRCEECGTVHLPAGTCLRELQGGGSDGRTADGGHPWRGGDIHHRPSCFSPSPPV